MDVSICKRKREDVYRAGECVITRPAEYLPIAGGARLPAPRTFAYANAPLAYATLPGVTCHFSAGAPAPSPDFFVPGLRLTRMVAVNEYCRYFSAHLNYTPPRSGGHPMRQDLVSLAKKVHELYTPPCGCKLNGEVRWHGVVKCARKILLHQAETLLDQFSKFGYTNVAVATEVKCDPSITSRAHGGGAELQLGLSKLFDLVRSLETAMDCARVRHFNMSIGVGANIVRPLDPCSSVAATDDLLNQAAIAIYSNVCSILLSRPAEARRSLPDGLEGVMSEFGDPLYGVTLIQVEPTDELDRLKRQLHEVKHFEERLESKIRRLEREKKLKEMQPPRARFS